MACHPPTFATNVFSVKKFLKMGLSTPLRNALTSGMPDPDAAGEITKSEKLARNASSRLKAVYCTNFNFQSTSVCCVLGERGGGAEWHTGFASGPNLGMVAGTWW